jgi:multicomponent Na+:H+ antiporter subunit D
VDYVPYTGQHVVFMLQLFLFSGLAFFLMLGWLQRTLTITLDLDWLYRRFGVEAARYLDRAMETGWARLVTAVERSAERSVASVYRHLGPDGALARTWPTGRMAFWTAVILAAYLILSYL